MTLSTSYGFSNAPFDQLLKTSFQLCGLKPSEVEGWKAQMAIQSANIILNDWVNRGNNLWLSQTMIMPIVPGQRTYLLPEYVSYIKELQAVRLVEIAPGGVISSDPATFWYGYSYDTLVSPQYFSLTFAQDNISIPIDIQYSLVPSPTSTYNDGNWTSAYSNPFNPIPTNYQAGIPYFFSPSAPVSAYGYIFRVNTPNNLVPVTGDVAFFLYTIETSRLLIALSENDYFSIPMPVSSPANGSVSSFYLDRQIQPSISLWPVPDATYDVFVMKAMTVPRDIGTLVNQGQLPARFARAFIYELAAELALEFAEDKYQLLDSKAKEYHDRAAIEDRERVPLRITPNMMGYT